MFPQTFTHHSPSRPFIILSEVESTNNYAMAKLHAGMLVPGTCILALEQTAGKGRRGKEWIASPGENLTMSTVFQPSSYIPFVYSAVIALGCRDFIKESGVDIAFVKWPNDVYIGDRKAAGILIENIYRAGAWQWSVAGTGVNLNQTAFGDLGNKAVSLKQTTGNSYPVVSSGKRLHQLLLERYNSLEVIKAEDILQEYNACLYKRGKEVRLKQGDTVFSTIIREVNLNGELITEDPAGRTFRVGEVEFV